MQGRKLLLILASLIIFSSCVGLRVQKSATHEFDRGLGLFGEGEYAQAVPYFEKAVEIDPGFARAYLYLGRSYLSLGRWQEAISPLRTAFETAPENPKKQIIPILADALFAAALSEFESGNFHEAIGYLRESLELKPQSFRLRNQLFRVLLALGEKYLAEGNIAEALTTFSESLQLSPRDVRAHVGLAKALFENGDFAKAMETVKKALQRDPANREAQELLNELFTKLPDS
jgi:tetratricopeptide (TPR) repeat protein